MTQRVSTLFAVGFLGLGAVVGTHMLAGAAPVVSPPPVSAVTVTGGAVEVTSAPPITGTVAVSSTPPVTGTVGVSSLPNVTISSLPAVTGSVAVTSAPPITGTVDVSTLPNVTVSSLPAVSGTVAVSSAPPVTGTVSVSSGSVSVSSIPAVNIGSSVRLDTNITNAFVPVAGDAGGARLEVAVPAGVAVTGTPNVSVTNIPTVALQNGTQVSLAGTSLTALTNATSKGICTYTNGQPSGQTVSTTASNVPASALSGRTAITVWNFEATRIMWCSIVGTASATSAVRVYPDGGWHKWEGLTAGMVVSCRCATSTCEYGYEEEKCYQ